eukprot:SAG22_NODE_1559_length_4124_cov_4.090186_2_plen_1021_part_00
MKKAKEAAALAADKTGVSAAAEKSGLNAMAERATAMAEKATEASGLNLMAERATQMAEKASDLASLATLTEGLTNITDMATGMADKTLQMAENRVGDLKGLSAAALERMGLAEHLGDIIGVRIVCKQTVTMGAGRAIGPYTVEKTTTEHKLWFDNDCSSAMNAGFFIQMAQLHDIAGGSRFSWQNNETVRQMVNRRDAAITFDAATCFEDETETQLLECKALKITPLVNSAGRIVATETHVYFQPFHSAESQDVRKWTMCGASGVEKVARRRYQLRKVAAELSFLDGDNLLLAFESTSDRDGFIECICEASGVEDDLEAHPKRMAEALEAWHEGNMSNYDYLLHLNTRAGRTVNDLTQYPVMPWVLKDYTSAALTLDSPDAFRDLSKPIGALEPERLKRFRDRYEQMPDDPAMPKFMYGSHYSTPGFVLFYMLRRAPEYMLRLQSGKFDQPDRLFSSIEQTWKGVLENDSDVKELTPEFYDADFSEFLSNDQQIDFGERQDGTKVDHVELPPWAGGDAKAFVETMREALESDFVSSHLHEWIDLIFGCKQRGKAAADAANVFYYLTYEGAIKMDEVDDPIERDSILAQINEYGQTPSQLFQTGHPAKGSKDDSPELCDLKKTPAPLASPRPLSCDSSDSSKKEKPILGSIRSVGLLPVTEPARLGPALGDGWCVYGIEALKCKRSIFVPKDLGDICLSADAKSLHITYGDASLRTFAPEEFQDGTEARQVRSATVGALRLASCVLASSGKVAIIGSWDNSLYLYSLEYGHLVERVENAHESAVSLLCIHGNTVVSASWDSTVKVWEFDPTSNTLHFRFQLMEHDAEITCLALDASGKWAATGSADGALFVWNVDSEMTCLHGCKSAELEPHETTVNAVAWTQDAAFLASAADDQSVRLYRVLGTGIGGEAEARLVCEVTVVEGECCSMRCLAFIGDRLIGGGDFGTLSVWTITRDGKDCDLVPISEQFSAGEADGALWDAEQAKHSKQHTVTAIKVCPEAETLVTVAEDGSMCLWAAPSK